MRKLEMLRGLLGIITRINRTMFLMYTWVKPRYSKPTIVYNGAIASVRLHSRLVEFYALMIGRKQITPRFNDVINAIDTVKNNKIIMREAVTFTIFWYFKDLSSSRWTYVWHTCWHLRSLFKSIKYPFIKIIIFFFL